MRDLRRPPPPEHQLPSILDWARGLEPLRHRFAGGTGPFSATLVSRAEYLSSQLVATRGEPVVLHGNLHQQNILSAKREPWLAIDLKGLIGKQNTKLAPFYVTTCYPSPNRMGFWPGGLTNSRMNWSANQTGSRDGGWPTQYWQVCGISRIPAKFGMSQRSAPD